MLHIPSTLSALPCGAQLDLYDSQRSQLAGSVSYTTSPDVTTLRLDIGARVVARGDLLDPRWRSWLATDLRLCYSGRKADRTELLCLLSDVAALWDAHCASCLSGVLP